MLVLVLVLVGFYNNNNNKNLYQCGSVNRMHMYVVVLVLEYLQLQLQSTVYSQPKRVKIRLGEAKTGLKPGFCDIPIPPCTMPKNKNDGGI